MNNVWAIAPKMPKLLWFLICCRLTTNWQLKGYTKWFGRRRNAGIEIFSISTLRRRPNYFVCTSGRNATQRKSLRHIINQPLFVTRYRPRNCGWCVIRARVHWRMASNNQPPRPPQSSPQKIAGVRSQLRSKRSSNGPSSENFLATGGFFNATLIALRR